MKKLLVSSLLASGIASCVYAGDIGIGFGTDMGFGITAQFNEKINIQVGNAGVAADYLFLSGGFDSSDVVTWYVGAGAGYYFGEWTAHAGDIDLRVPLGFDWNFGKQFDAYAQAIPGMRILESGGMGFGYNGAVGIRYFF